MGKYLIYCYAENLLSTVKSFSFPQDGSLLTSIATSKEIEDDHSHSQHVPLYRTSRQCTGSGAKTFIQVVLSMEEIQLTTCDVSKNLADTRISHLLFKLISQISSMKQYQQKGFLIQSYFTCRKFLTLCSPHLFT